MKFHVLLMIMLIVGITSGCKKLDKLTQFNIGYTEQVVIPSSTGINLPFNLLTPDITTNSEATFASNNTRKDLIQEIKLTAMTLTVKSPPNGNFGFLKSIAIFINADGLPEAKVAWKDNIPANPGKSIVLDVTGNDLQEYIKKDKYSLRLNTVMDELITSDYTIEVHSTFFVDAKILGH